MDETAVSLFQGSQTARCRRANPLTKEDLFTQSQRIDTLNSDFKIKKRNKFKTFPRSCLKEK